MPWLLRAEGHAASEAAEKDLFGALGELLGEEEFGTGLSVYFEGSHIQGNPRSQQDQETASRLTEHADEPDELPGHLPLREAAARAAEEEEPPAALVKKGGDYPVQAIDVDHEPEVSDLETGPEAAKAEGAE